MGLKSRLEQYTVGSYRKKNRHRLLLVDDDDASGACSIPVHWRSSWFQPSKLPFLTLCQSSGQQPHHSPRCFQLRVSSAFALLHQHLGETIANAQLLRIRQTIQRSEEVSFGPYMAASSRGLRCSGKLIPWAKITDITYYDRIGSQEPECTRPWVYVSLDRVCLDDEEYKTLGLRCKAWEVVDLETLQRLQHEFSNHRRAEIE